MYCSIDLDVQAFKEITDRVKLIEKKYLLLAQRVSVVERNQHYLSYYGMYPMMNPVLNPETAVTAPLTTNPPAVPNKENEAPTTSVSASSTIKKKESPPIDYKTLITPEEVIEKYPKFINKSKISMLAVRLAKEAFFGKEYMSYCTYKGVGKHPALADKEVQRLKSFLRQLSIPRIVTSSIEFEAVYKTCVESIGQACKSLRKQRLAGLKLE